MRDVFLNALSSTARRSDGPGHGGGVAAPLPGADLFHGSPAEQFLQLRGQLKASASAGSTRASDDAGLHEASEPQSASSETSSGSSTQQAAARLLAEALQSWSKASLKAACVSPAKAPSAFSVVAEAASSSATALAKKSASKPRALQPRPPPPRHKAHDKGQANTSVEEAGRGQTMPSASSPSPPLPVEGAACDEDGEGLDAEADAVWVQMQAQVVKEMDRLAIVRKHRVVSPTSSIPGRHMIFSDPLAFQRCAAVARASTAASHHSVWNQETFEVLMQMLSAVAARLARNHLKRKVRRALSIAGFRVVACAMLGATDRTLGHAPRVAGHPPRLLGRLGHAVVWALHGKRMFKKEEDKDAACAAAAMVVGTEAGVERGRERAGLPLARAASMEDTENGNAAVNKYAVEGTSWLKSCGRQLPPPLRMRLEVGRADSTSTSCLAVMRTGGHAARSSSLCD
ncbi:hypothetical protein CGC20_30300 [Leishmania donovani]|uniref:Uncharacterized protein n=1 Tax=Leishmania donovani TaxID=5661 RepID=A0A504XX68_LEIDO|nr:hypothetical protein CGC20_30300 [Leishmania donovani]